MRARNRPCSTDISEITVCRNRLSVIAVETDMVKALGAIRPKAVVGVPPHALRPEVFASRELDHKGVRALAHVFLRFGNTICHLAPRRAPRARRRRVVGALQEARGTVVVRARGVDLVGRFYDAVARGRDVRGAAVAVARRRHC